MAAELFESLLNQKLEISDFKKWLSNDTVNESTLEQIVTFSCGRGEFVIYFLNHLRDQTAHILNSDTKQVRKIKTPQRKNSTTETITPKPKRIELFPINKQNGLDVSDRNFPKLGGQKSEIKPTSSTPEIKNKSHEISFLGVSQFSDSFIDISTSTPISNRSQTNESDSKSRSKQSKSFDFEKKRVKSSEICLGDFIQPSRMKAKKCLIPKTETRRIKPTSLQTLPVENVVISDAFKSPMELDRNQLRVECLKIQDNIPELTPTKPLQSKSETYIDPTLDEVTIHNVLDVYIEIYTTFIENNLILNIINELYFLISLLRARQIEKEYLEFCTALEHTIGSSELEPLQTIHNCVYFAIKVLSNLSILEFLDRPTLKLLESNVRIKDFSSEFHEKLSRIYQCKVESDASKSQLELCKGVENVCFIPDTDNRNNFPNNQAFQTFRKQRDLFYEILRTWEINHLNRPWNFNNLEKMIKQLLSLSLEPLNFLHLARLFKFQLLNSCGFVSNTTETNVISSTLKNISATKLSLLQSRLITPQAGENSNDFVGHQEFYCKFLLYVNKPNFLFHLRDSFISEIYELQKDGIFYQDLNSESNIDAESKLKCTVTIFALKLLAKFLSYIECLPYKTTSIMPNSESIVAVQKTVRFHVQNQLDIKSFIINAIENQTLIVTLPWVCDYFAMSDFITIRLPCHQETIQLLFEIYADLHSNLNQTFHPESMFLLRSCIGWLFEKSHFPEELYFKWLTELNHHKSLSELANKSHKSLMKLDTIELIDERILYKLCPYLNELKQLLTSSELDRSYITARHITPVSTVPFAGSASAKQIELQLEETFFSSHPPSMRKTVDFVAERIASGCVKHVCNTLVPEFKQTSKSELLEQLTKINKDLNKIDLNLKTKQARVVADKYFSELCLNYCPENLCHDRCMAGLQALLAPDLEPAVLKLCVEYSVRQAKEKIIQWMQSHVSSDIFMIDLNELNSLKSLGLNDVTNTTTTEDVSTVSVNESTLDITMTPVEIICKTRELVGSLLDRTASIDVQFLKLFLTDVCKSLQQRDDLTPLVQKECIFITLDLALAVVSFIPSAILVTTKHFIKVWKTFTPIIVENNSSAAPLINNTFEAVPMDLEPRPMEPVSKSKNDNRFHRIICPRNVFLLEQSSNPKQSWTSLGFLLFEIIKDGKVLSVRNLEPQCTSFFQSEWPQVVLEHFSVCLRTLCSEYRRWKGEDEFTILLEFLYETCEQINREDGPLDFM